ncbi:unnamed protein product [Urochloa decumbens]|uniref:DUF1618 domain-containing protein n=1 Tax=Urochloa decumbens TaxID=240449 RepID=A0ABC9FVS9_9POAL
MSSDDTASSRRRRHRRRRRHGSSVPAWVLLNNEGYIGSRPNATTAVAYGRDDSLRVEASLYPARPPLPSNLFVSCPGVKFPRPSTILSTAGDLLLFRVPVAAGPPPRCAFYKDCDYFVYRAGDGAAKPPSLTLIPNPSPNNVFHDVDVGVLPRGGDHFTVAALVLASSTMKEYTLGRFDSEAGSTWASKSVWLDEPRRAPFPVKIPVDAGRLNHHITTTVITLGGDAGTVGWVDLWSGILLYDLLRDHDDGDHEELRDGRRPTLRHMPVPVPMHAITCNRGAGAKLGCPRAHRGITVATNKCGKACLKFADLQTIGGRLPYRDVETMLPAYEVDDWIVTAWSNAAMGCSFEDWHEDFTVRGSEIRVGDAARAELLASGLLHRKPRRDDDGEEPDTVVEIALQNLSVSEPTPSQDADEDVLYLMARTKLFLPKAWALAIDMRNSELLGVAEFGTENGRDVSVTYRPSTISKYMKPVVAGPG